jgi:hypothetical protein
MRPSRRLKSPRPARHRGALTPHRPADTNGTCELCDHVCVRVGPECRIQISRVSCGSAPCSSLARSHRARGTAFGTWRRHAVWRGRTSPNDGRDRDRGDLHPRNLHVDAELLGPATVGPSNRLIGVPTNECRQAASTARCRAERPESSQPRRQGRRRPTCYMQRRPIRRYPRHHRLIGAVHHLSYRPCQEVFR